jgi:hypothetical protein
MFSNMFHHVSKGFLGFETCTKFTKKKLTLFSFVPKVISIVTTLQNHIVAPSWTAKDFEF